MFVATANFFKTSRQNNRMAKSKKNQQKKLKTVNSVRHNAHGTVSVTSAIEISCIYMQKFMTRLS